MVWTNSRSGGTPTKCGYNETEGRVDVPLNCWVCAIAQFNSKPVGIAYAIFYGLVFWFIAINS